MTRHGKARFPSYTRRCKRCDNFYSTPHKESEICPDCYKPKGGKTRGKKK